VVGFAQSVAPGTWRVGQFSYASLQFATRSRFIGRLLRLALLPSTKFGDMPPPNFEAPPYCVSSWRYGHFAPFAVRAHCVENFIEEARRQETVVKFIAARNLAQIVARPQELISFIDNDPRLIEVKPEQPLNGLWYLDCRVGMIGRAMRDW
jgi:hypothetical protein